MLAKAADSIPAGPGWLYEPKWDGFRALVFFDGSGLYLQSRDLKPLGRYFPELEEQLPRTLPAPMILDGEIVIARGQALDFEALQMRIHPAASRVRMLAQQTPASFVAFDLLSVHGEDIRGAAFADRRRLLETALAEAEPPVFLTPSTDDAAVAQDWFERFEGAGLDGVVAKRLEDVYRPGQRAMIEIKHLRTVDCVVAGYRWNRGEEGRSVGSLLLGLYDDAGVLHHVGHTSSFKAQEKRDLVSFLEPYVSDDDQRRLRSRPHARRTEPLDRRPRHDLGASAPRAGLRGDVRLSAGPARPRGALPPRRDLPALALRQAADGLRLRPDRDDAAVRAERDLRRLESQTLVLLGLGVVLALFGLIAYLVFVVRLHNKTLYPTVDFDLWPGETSELEAPAELRRSDLVAAMGGGRACLTDLRLLWVPTWPSAGSRREPVAFRRTRLQNVEAYSAVGDVGFSFSAEGNDYLLLFSWGMAQFGDPHPAAAFLEALAETNRPESKRVDGSA